MHKDTMMELLPHVVQVCTPVVGALADHHYTKKELELRKEFEVEKAERTAQGLQQIGSNQPAHHPTHDQQPANAGEQPAPQPQPPQGDVYDRLRDIRRTTDCDFCKKAADGLLDEPEDVARQGEQELREYLDRSEALRASNASRDKVEQTMASLTDGWEVLPDMMAGAV